MQKLGRFLGKRIRVYSLRGLLLADGTLEYSRCGFVVKNEITQAYVSKRILRREKIGGKEGYQFVTKDNYDILKEPSPEGFQYDF